ncbi:MAG: hypothetical protein EYC70_12290 [Planctomycetota bacterium]|nr:MAG: hypothetical protein EYC70_12290 [Planctomycetota bacterium]
MARARPWICLGLAAFFSGFSALAFEILWIRRLGEVFGSTVLGVHIVLALFFLGLGAGAWLGGRWADRERGHVRVYLALEAVIALSGLLFLPGADLLDTVYLRVADPESGLATSLALKGTGAGLLLAAPTLAMGGTIPALTRHLANHVAARRDAIGWLYGINTIAAGCGAALVVFGLIPYLGMVGATATAAAGSLAALILASAGSRGSTQPALLVDPGASARGTTAPARWLCWSVALSGFVSIGMEVLWTRALASRFLSTIYSFAAIVSVFLLALGAGSLLLPVLQRAGWVQRRSLGLVLAGAAILSLASLVFLAWTPSSLSGAGAAGRSFAATSLRELGASAVVMALPVMAFGLAFPLVVCLLQREAAALGAAIGRVYWWNTLGSVTAPLLLGFLLLPALGLRSALLGLSWCGLAFGVVLVASAGDGRRRRLRLPAALVCAGAAATLLVPGDLRLWRRNPGDRLLAYREGVMASAAVVAQPDGDIVLKLNNDYELGSVRTRFAQSRQALLPVLLHPRPARVLFLGVGTGCSVGAAAAYGGLQIDAIEIVPDLRPLLPYFREGNYDLLGRAAADPGLRLLWTDARDYVRITDRRYDLVIGDLFIPWRAGEGGMYMREHLQAVADCLAPDGFYCQWLPLYQLGTQELRIVTATFCDVFPAVSAWWLYFNLEQPVIGLLGCAAPRSWTRPQPERMDAHRALLEAAGLNDARPLLASWIADEAVLRKWSAGAPIETRNRPRIEFLAPLRRVVPNAVRAAENVRTCLDWMTPPPAPEAVAYQEAIGCFFRAGLASSAEQRLDKLAAALRAAPDWDWIAWNLDQQIRQSLASRRYPLAARGAEALAEAPRFAAAGAYYQALAAREQGDLELARTWLQQALQHDPAHAPSRKLWDEIQAR